MMRQVIGIVVLCAILGSSSAAAAGWNLGGSAGLASGDTGSGELNKELAARGLNATASSTDDSRTAWQLYFGYDYTPNWGVQMAYVDLGDVSTRFSGSTTDIDAFLASSSDIHPNTAQGVQLSGLYYYPLKFVPNLKAEARLGAFAWRSKYTLNGGTSSRTVEDRGTDIAFGLGLAMGLDALRWMPPGFSVTLNWDRYSIDSEPIDLYSLGVRYNL